MTEDSLSLFKSSQARQARLHARLHAFEKRIIEMQQQDQDDDCCSNSRSSLDTETSRQQQPIQHTQSFPSIPIDKPKMKKMNTIIPTPRLSKITLLEETAKSMIVEKLESPRKTHLIRERVRRTAARELDSLGDDMPGESPNQSLSQHNFWKSLQLFFQ